MGAIVIFNLLLPELQEQAAFKICVGLAND